MDNLSNINPLHFDIQHFSSLDSTNLEALRQAEQGADEGLVVIAAQQTAGKGRLGRKWHTIDHALAMSLLVRPPIKPVDVPKMSLLMAVVLHEALSKFTPDIRLKWPNDLLIQGKKVSGILTEMRCAQQRIKAVVLGVGVNIQAPHDGWAEDIQQPATDLSTASGKTISQDDVVLAILASFQTWYARFLSQGFAPVRQAWWAAHTASGKRVRVYDGESYIEGIAHALAEDGALRLLVNGEERRIIAGDVLLMEDNQ